ncbi:hypothetical protein [Nitrosospira sp. NpAV]|uniref:hypothetical protein n=1 Tax=Nitrosospira sp. NpAV TaxID=58133 RepID=UPI0012EB90AC|nr:hypothetical protein [Nitrosospira sp. NpAV]
MSIRRRTAMAAGLAITAWLAIQVDDREEEGVIQLAHSTQRTPGPSNTGDGAASPELSAALNWSALSGRTRLTPEQDSQSADLFKSHDWVVASKPSEAPAPPPTPVVPDPPFSYLGKLADSPAGTTYFLSENNKVHSVVAGQNIDNVWRLDTEDATSLNLTYLPLGQPQTLLKTARPAVSAEDGHQGAF